MLETTSRSWGACLIVAGLVASTALSLLFNGGSAAAYHSPNWPLVQAPFGGTWDAFGDANPSNHQTTTSADDDWATDFFQAPGVTGRLRATTSDGSSLSMTVIDNGPSCLNVSESAAGKQYQLKVVVGGVELGWFVFKHIDPAGISYGLNAQISTSGGYLGKTKLYQPAVPDCWEVNYSNGTHWHVGAFNIHAYACYYPWSQGAFLSSAQVLGAVGANATGQGQPCWTPPPYP